jgi:hypothetical protein
VTHHEDDMPFTDEEHALAQRGAALIAAAVAHPEARAPQALRETLERDRAAAHAHRRRRVRLRGRLVAPGLLAIGVLVVALVVAGGGPEGGVGPPSIRDVAAVTRLPARRAAPTAVGGLRLSVAVEGLAFPDWRRAFGWKATGRRTDRVGDRTVTTVRYRYSGKRVLGYAIVAGPPLAASGGRDVVRDGARYRVVTRAGRTTVTWTQLGHTCVIDAPAGVAAATLVTLAGRAGV